MRALSTLLVSLVITGSLNAQWTQWGRDPQHTGVVSAAGQKPERILADFIYDPFVADERERGGGTLLVHYQAPLLDADDVYITKKSGTYTSVWSTQIWNVANLRWSNGALSQRWLATTDWKPAPQFENGGGPFFEPVFHPILANGALYMPGLGGTILQIDRFNGAITKRINPFGATIDASVYVAGPLAADNSGNIYYNAMQFAPSRPWTSEIAGSWLVKVTAAGVASRVSYTTLTPNAPSATDSCLGNFANNELPWPPSPDAIPPSAPCGSQRPGLNVAPAIGANGTVYVVSRAHLNSRYAHLIAVNPDLTLQWAASLRDRLNDGCNVLIPANGTPGGCRAGARTGVDPGDNTAGAGRVNDDSTSSPVVAPDGSIFYGAYTRFNYAQGHMMHFTSTGTYLGAYRFGWDITPAIWSHDQTYSVITKENHYGVGSYCNDSQVCPPQDESYFITRFSPALNVEWQYRNTNTSSCERQPNGTIRCENNDHPDGFEWCVNAPAVDANGVVYVNNEDGFLYAIDRNGQERGAIFLQLAIGAAYTPLSIDSIGRIYTQNAGHLFVVGESVPLRRRSARH